MRAWIRGGLGVLVALLVALSQPVMAQSLASLVGAEEKRAATSQAPSAQELESSLDQIIATLENSEQRQALLESLKQLRQATAAEAQAEPAAGGLLGALAQSFSVLEHDGLDNPINYWGYRVEQAGNDLERLWGDGGRVPMALLDLLWVTALWVGVTLVVSALWRALVKRLGLLWALPQEPTTWMLVRHLARRVVPLALGFGVALVAVHQATSDTIGVTLAMVMAYVTLCGAVFAAVCEIVFSLFGSGHRHTALRILRQRGAPWLFALGALVALGDASNSAAVVEPLGRGLMAFVSLLANVCAALLLAAFVLVFRRPFRHLMRNRPYTQRQERRATTELLRLFSRIWHIPILVMVVVSLIAMVTSAEDSRSAFFRALVTAGMMIATLVISGLIHRQREKSQDKRLSEYSARLIRFGFTLAHLLAWLVFLELAMRVWGTSLWAVSGSAGIGQQIARSVLGLGLTFLVAWLVWILADTAVQHALRKSSRRHGRRANASARAQTITPLLRNTIFVTIAVIAAIIALANLGVNVTPLLAGAGVIGLAVGFGAQTLVQDLITGLFILIEDSLAIDDFVNLGSHMGTVEALSIRTVKLRDLDGIVHIIPFSQIQGIQNYSREFGIALLRIRIGHQMKIDDAIETMRSIADELRNDPMMRHHIWSPLEVQGIESFDAGAAILRIRMRTAPVMQWDVARAFNLRLKQRFDEQGLDLGMPRMSVVMEESRAARGDTPSDGSPREAITNPGAPDPQ
ncbi:mechanosensitive ion channel [Salinicola sp. JS01]|uniref:mechanosensitive ion channel family protein n=1 Tax=Salinicola sp. JS01 TaxID=3050071 RepID=UPI00255C0FDE|nr:mechanosensitive ion channel domain-containing protein [Salinicola sp. JS01]WIX33709.1 mechanosensitive ion channel [Salinicola sp. JS01]